MEFCSRSTAEVLESSFTEIVQDLAPLLCDNMH